MGEAWNTHSHPSSPHPTSAAKAAPMRASLRPPIFNPYDRFTQPEFDSWIGDITGALKRALGHEPQPTVNLPSHHSGSWNTVPNHPGGSFSADGRARPSAPSEDWDEESPDEDSFAQIASRRAKGKARDPREGPGLGIKDQPIELLSDSEEEEVVDSLEVDAVISGDSDSIDLDGSSGETDYAESEVDEGGEANVGQPGTSTQHIIAFLSTKDSVHNQEVTGHFDSKARRAREEDLPFPRNTETFRNNDDDGNEGFAVLGNIGRTDDEFHIPSQSVTPCDVELADPWDGPRTYAEDYYSGGDRLVPGLTPNRLTPICRSPAPTLPGLPTASNAEGRPFTSPSVSSTPPLSKARDTVDGDDLSGFPQYGATESTFVDQEDVDELASEPYYDHVGVVDVTVHTVEETEPEAVESAEGVGVIKARLLGKENPASYSTRSNMGTNGRDTDRELEIIWAARSDDEYTDADVEEDEGKFTGIMPLGTSDLDIRDDWGATDGHKDSDYASEEDGLRGMTPTQTADDVAKAAALTLSQFSESVNSSGLNVPLVDPRAPILASTFQLADADSFGDLPVSLPPSEPPSPALGRPTEGFELQHHSIEQLIADFEREASDKRSQVSETSGLLARRPDAETADSWASRELEHILSGDISVPENVAGDSDSSSMERRTSQGATLFTHFPEYIVEEVKFGTQVLLPDDDLGDTHSIPSPDLAEVVEMDQLYEVEEPRTDGRLTEEPEITITSSLDDNTSVPRPIVSSVESAATPITAEQHVPASTIQEPSHPSRAPASDAHRADFFTADQNIPAPIVADASVPDPVPGGDSNPPSPPTTDSLIGPGLSIAPPAALRVIDYDPFQISSGTSGLFTPAQRSDGGTPIQLEDDVAEALTIPRNGADTGLEAASVPLRTGVDPPLRFITDDENGSKAEAKDVRGENELTEPSQLVSDERQLRIGAVDVGTPKPQVDTIESAAEASPPTCQGSAKPTISQSSKASLLKSEVLSGILFQGSAEHSGVLDPSSGYALKTPSIAEGDEDADGEADPDYSSTHDTKTSHQKPAHQPVGEGREVASSKLISNILGPEVIASELENVQTSVSQKQETKAIGETPSPNLVKANHGKEHPTQALKRKRRDPKPGSARITRSKSGVGVLREKKENVLTSHRSTATSEKVQSDQVDVNIDADSVDDGASEASASSGTSAVYRLLHPTSRAGSVDSSASGDAPPARPIPLIHTHGLHHHGSFVPPPFNSPPSSSESHKDTRPDEAKAKSPTPTCEPSTPSLKWTPSINSPVTRSNCRFHKISLPRGEDEVRAYFVVPGCALGDGELMDRNDIRDEGYSTHEDHKRLLPNVETLDLSPYLIGVLRQLVGVDLLREQQEIFYLPSEDEKPKKRRVTGALGGLRQLQRQSISSGGLPVRDHSPQPSEASHNRRSPPLSGARSAASPSVQEESVVHNDDEDSALSELDNNDGPGQAPPAKRHKYTVMEVVPPLENTPGAGELGSSPVPEHSSSPGKEPTNSSRSPVTRRSKRRNLNYDAAAYKPNEDEVKDEEEEDIKTRRSSTRRATKRTRTMEESSANPPKSKKTRLGRSISVAGAGATDA